MSSADLLHIEFFYLGPPEERQQVVLVDDEAGRCIFLAPQMPEITARVLLIIRS
ncbi:MAG: hypothetical protein U1F27_13330 [Turneriella sp.]